MFSDIFSGAVGGKLAQYSDKNERGRPLCPNIHPNFSWMKVRTDFHDLTFCRRTGLFQDKAAIQVSICCEAQSASEADSCSSVRRFVLIADYWT
jgi:hypothetical protein